MNNRNDSLKETAIPKDLERLGWVLDKKFEAPGGIRFGLDTILGLVPGLGDSIASLFSSYFIFRAYELGVPIPTILRMVLNIGIDYLIGSIPFVGDIFDIFWKANIKNYQLVEESLKNERLTKHKSTAVLVTVILLICLIVALPFYIAFSVFSYLIS